MQKLVLLKVYKIHKICTCVYPKDKLLQRNKVLNHCQNYRQMYSNNNFRMLPDLKKSKEIEKII